MAYTTAAKVAALLNVSSSEIGADLLVWADALVDTTVGEDFTEHDVEDELQDGTGTNEILLDHYPVTELTKVEWEDADRVWHELACDPEEPTEQEVVLYADEGRLKLKLLPNSDWWSIVDYHSGDAVFEEGTQNWRFNYSYGYTEVPAAIQLLASLYAAQQYCLQRGRTPEVSSEKIGDYSIGYATDGQSTVKIKTLIDTILAQWALARLDVRGV